VGFIEEESQDAAAWSKAVTHYGLHWERDGGDQTGTWYYRFTPINENGVKNVTARALVGITLKGDQSPPAAPADVRMEAQFKSVTVETLLQRPLSQDLASVDLIFYQIIGGDFSNPVSLRQIRTGVTKDTGTTGLLSHRVSLNLDWLGYGTTVYAISRTVDFTGNFSAWFGSDNAITLSQITTPDLGSASVATIQYFTNDAALSLGSSNPGSLLAQLTITTIGGSVDLSAKITATATGDAVGHYILALATSPSTGLGLVQLDGLDINTGNLMAATTVPAGTYTFELWGYYTATSGLVTATSRKFKIQENRGGFG